MAPAGDGSALLTVLGSGTLVPDAAHHGAAHLVEAPGVRLLLDCGWGTVDGLARHGVAWPELTHLAVTHFHTDHVGDLSALLMALKHGVSPRRTRPLTLVGPRGMGAFLERLASVLGSHLVDPGFDLDVVELRPGEVFDDPGGRLSLACHPTPHTDASVAYRVALGAASVGYTGDTGPSEALGAFLRGCQVLVAECNQSDPPEVDTHLSPSGLAALAGQAEPGTLVVTHVSPPATPQEMARRVAERWPGRVVAGEDGLRIPLG